MNLNGGLKKRRWRARYWPDREHVNGTPPLSPLLPGIACFRARGPAKGRHWPLDLIHLHSVISTPFPMAGAGPSNPSPRPLKLLLHLSNPPHDKLMMPSSVDNCKTQWLNQLREADFVKYRNTARVTAMRKADLDAGWDGLLQGT